MTSPRFHAIGLELAGTSLAEQRQEAARLAEKQRRAEAKERRRLERAAAEERRRAREAEEERRQFAAEQRLVREGRLCPWAPWLDTLRTLLLDGYKVSFPGRDGGAHAVLHRAIRLELEGRGLLSHRLRDIPAPVLPRYLKHMSYLRWLEAGYTPFNEEAERFVLYVSHCPGTRPTRPPRPGIPALVLWQAPGWSGEGMNSECASDAAKLSPVFVVRWEDIHRATT